MVDQHLGNHQPLLKLCVGFAHEQRTMAAGVGQQPGRHRRHAREDQVPKLTRSNPTLQLAIPRPEPPVLVRHQPRFARHPADQCLRLGERRRHGFLAQHVDAVEGGGVDPTRVRFARRNDVECVDLLRGEHRIGVAINARDGKFFSALGRPDRIGIAHRNKAHALTEASPADKVIPADHSGAGQRDLQWFGHGSSLQSRRVGADCDSARTPGRRNPAAIATMARARPRRWGAWAR